MQTTACSKCGSTELIRDVRIMDRGHGSADSGNLSAVVYGNPEAWMFKGRVRVELSACVCGHCGFTELYAVDPAAMLAAARAAEE
jgi:predicted nucleic-acid-binding Zn-ribbon protein